MKTILRKAFWTLFFLLLLGSSTVGLLYIYLVSQLPDVDALKDVRLQVPLRVFSADHQLIAEYGEKRRIPVKYDQVPQLLIRAILATEDQRFFEHPGVDIMGLGRAGVELIKTGAKHQGGSTITMQVARNFFLSRKKTFLRKFNEILLAIKIDHELPKEKILELYLNKIYFGNRAYGIAAAAQVYFGKTLDQLTLSEMAMLAGLPKAPSSLNPIVNPQAALKRRNHVLERLFSEGYITEIMYKSALNEPLISEYHGAKVSIQAPYVGELIRQEMFASFGKDAYTKGYQVITTLDSHLQAAANQSVMQQILAYDRRHGYRGPVMILAKHDRTPVRIQARLNQLPTIQGIEPVAIMAIDNQQATVLRKNRHSLILDAKAFRWVRPQGNLVPYFKPGQIIYIRPSEELGWELAQLPQIEGALIALAPQSGAIKALVGGFSFEHSKFNRITQATRQPGSSIKPFIYAAALDKGLTLASIINDAPVVLDDPSLQGLWRPQNDNHQFNGPTRLRVGLTTSRNLVSIRLLEMIGLRHATEYLKKLGFDPAKIPHSLSLALGSLNISPLELARGYAVIANGGYLIDPYLIQEIRDSRDRVLVQAKPKIAVEAALPGEEVAPRVMDARVNYLINLVLHDVIQEGTAKRATELKRPDLAGKTGTTNDQVDGWFAGFMPDLVVTTWMGFDQPKSIHEFAASSALPMWIEFMKKALPQFPARSLPRPDGLVTMRIDPKTGLAARDGQADAIFETFMQEHIPAPAPSPTEVGGEQQNENNDSNPIF